MKRLIVTADDFGLSPGVNAGVVAAFRDGIVTRASLLAVGEAFSDAVALAKRHLGLNVGVHLAVTEERPLSAPAKIPSLLGPDGSFLKTYGKFCVRYAAGGIDGAELELEWRAQIERVLDAGLAPGHLDSHCHLGVLPLCHETMKRLALEYRIPYLRLPVGPLGLESSGKPGRSMLFSGIGVWARHLRKRLPAAVACADHVVGLRHSGALDARKVLAILRRLPEGTSELVCHPGVADEAARARYGHWGYDWDGELRALTDPEVARAVEKL